MSFLQTRHKVRRLQRYWDTAKALNQSRQNILSQAQRQLRRLSKKSEKGNQTCQVHGATAVYRLIGVYLTGKKEQGDKNVKQDEGFAL